MHARRLGLCCERMGSLLRNRAKLRMLEGEFQATSAAAHLDLLQLED